MQARLRIWYSTVGYGKLTLRLSDVEVFAWSVSVLYPFGVNAYRACHSDKLIGCVCYHVTH